MLTFATRLAEQVGLPDTLTRFGITRLVAATDRRLGHAAPQAEAAFAADFTNYPIAAHTDAANAQHYELPESFFGLVLGPHRKYSSCLYTPEVTTLAEAEQAGLRETCAHAGLENGQTVLELGCGWGSLSLWMAATYPASRITAVSNSKSQRAYIEAQAAARGLTNLVVITADMNDFAPEAQFDRIVSVEMFEHMANWRGLLTRARGWLAPGGRLFIHVFTHHQAPYRFDHTDKADWIAQHFFTGGIMPSHGLIRHFPDLFELESSWRWSGTHYQRTADAWLANMDANADAVMEILGKTYGAEAKIWFRRWRLFFLATSGLFGFRGGGTWGVSHYRLRPVEAV